MAQAAAKKKKKGDEVATFLYDGLDKAGKKVKGEVRARTLAAAKAEVRRIGINAKKVRKKPKDLFGSKGKVEAKDISIFARQLATMMDAGVPLVQAFDLVGNGSENPAMGELVLKIKADVEGGTALADALANQPLYFDDLFCNLVRAGEAAGVLETMLDNIATYKEKTESLKGKIKKAMFYPIAVIVVALLVTSVIMIFVIPQFQSLFSSFGAELPAFTQLVIRISEFMQAYWWLVFGSAGAAIYGLMQLNLRSRKFREIKDRVVLHLPIIGPIMHKAAVARFARTMSTMFAAGVPLVEALQSVSGATGNAVYANAVLRMREEVATGTNMMTAMKAQNVFPSMVVQMTSIGEESGALDTMLAKVADFYEEEVDNAVDALSSLLEPLIMVILGTLVGGLVVAMYLPIFQMAAAV